VDLFLDELVELLAGREVPERLREAQGLAVARHLGAADGEAHPLPFDADACGERLRRRAVSRERDDLLELGDLELGRRNAVIQLHPRLPPDALRKRPPVEFGPLVHTLVPQRYPALLRLSKRSSGKEMRRCRPEAYMNVR
jgi:hypothetical protein